MLDGINLVGFLFVALLAQIFGTVAGFGAATVLTPFAALFMDIHSAIAVVAIFHLLGNISKVALFRQHIEWPLFFKFGAASIVFTIAGAFLASKTPSGVLTALFGSFLVIYVLLSVVYPHANLPDRTSTAVWGGISSGFVAGLIGTGGAIRGAFLLAFNRPKNIYIATSAMISTVIDATRVPVYFASGFLRKDQAALLVGLVVMAFLGATIGKRVVSLVPQNQFKKFILVILLIMGLRMLWSGLSS